MPEVRIPSFNDFSPEILKDLRPCLRAVVDGGGVDREVILTWARTYFGGKENKRSSTNIPATLGSTGLSTAKRPIDLSPIGLEIANAASAHEAARLFCAHLLREKNGKLVVEALSGISARGDKVTKASLKKELIKLGMSGLSNNTTDHSTLKNWLVNAGLVTSAGAPIDAEIKAILGISSSELSAFKCLSLGQQVFLRQLRSRHLVEPGPFQVKDVFGECLEIDPHLFDEAQFAKKIRTPLLSGGWIEADGLARGAHGGRSGTVSGTKKLLDIPVSELVPDFDQVVPSDLREKLNTPLGVISTDLFGSDTHKAGLALELLSLRMVVDLGLEARAFRLRSARTAHAEVDLIAEGAHLLFSRWTIQCKRYGPDTKTKLDLGDVAKEVGIAIFARAHVVMLVTTTGFTQSAIAYAREISRSTHLQFVFIDGALIKSYLKSGRVVLWSHLKANARDVMTAKREQPLPRGDFPVAE